MLKLPPDDDRARAFRKCGKLVQGTLGINGNEQRPFLFGFLPLLALHHQPLGLFDLRHPSALRQTAEGNDRC